MRFLWTRQRVHEERLVRRKEPDSPDHLPVRIKDVLPLVVLVDQADHSVREIPFADHAGFHLVLPSPGPDPDRVVQLELSERWQSHPRPEPSHPKLCLESFRPLPLAAPQQSADGVDQLGQVKGLVEDGVSASIASNPGTE